MSDAAHLLDCLSVGYRLDLDDDAWLRALVDAAVPLFDVGLGVMGYTYDASDPHTPLYKQFLTSDRFDPEWLPPFYEEINAPNRPTGFQSWSMMMCGQATLVEGMRPFLPAFRHIGGAKDTFAINALDASQQGLFLGGPMLTTDPVPAPRVKLFTRLAAHLTTAARLRRTAQRTTAAVLSPRGALLHAEDEGVSSAREELRAAARAFHDARQLKGRDDVDTTTRRWRPLVESRWSLLDEFDTDGKHFVVAVENTPPTRASSRELSDRELQVMTHAHLGHSNKVIAYELGLAASTVRVLLHRAARKLGATTREEAIARFDAELATRTHQ